MFYPKIQKILATTDATRLNRQKQPGGAI